MSIGLLKTSMAPARRAVSTASSEIHADTITAGIRLPFDRRVESRLEAAHAGQSMVRDDEVDSAYGDFCQGCLGAGNRNRVVSGNAGNLAEVLAERQVVLHDQDAARHGFEQWCSRGRGPQGSQLRVERL